MGILDILFSNKEKKNFLQHYLKIEEEFIRSNCYQKDFFKMVKSNIRKIDNDTFKKTKNIEISIYNLLADCSLNELHNTADTHLYPGLLTDYGKCIARIYKHCIDYFEKNNIYTEEELKIAKKNLTDRIFNY